MALSINDFIKNSPLNTIDDFITHKTLKCNAYEIEKGKEITNFLENENNDILKLKKLPSIFSDTKQYKTFVPINLRSTSVIIKNQRENSYILTIVFKDTFFTPHELLEMCLPGNIQIPSSYQVIGTILHVNLTYQQLSHKLEIGKAFLSIKNIETVVTKIDSITSVFRNAKFEIIGTKSYNTECLKTVHLENGIKYFIDYENVYWNSKLQEERRKVLEEIKPGSVVLDPFCGVGPIVLPALKKACKVLCNDLNPIAIDCLKKNLQLNKLNAQSIVIYNKCAKNFLQDLPNLIKSNVFVEKIDYIFFNLPEMSLEFLQYLKKDDVYKNAVIFCFFFCKKNVNVKSFIYEKNLAVNSNVIIKEIRNVAPSKLMYILKGLVSDIIIT
ncbi:tRNA (guanine(37)-N1)-methyltransferase [Cucumispora dikerogammari]|nr:tRNA (guanine(37)-N1)-methyltransferase [Cucumispora dikerogammari]